MEPLPLPALWRRADEPVAGHEIASRLLAGDRYARTRGVAQQAARLARARKLERSDRRRLLAAAWLHDSGPAELGSHASLVIARRLRSAGSEELARIVAHCGGAPMAAALAEHPPVVREFPVPAGGDSALLMLLDVAIITTRSDGAPGTPVDALRDRLQHVPAGDPGVRALVALVARIGDDPDARELVEMLGRRAG